MKLTEKELNEKYSVLGLDHVSFEKTFDLQHLKAIHKHIFQGVYEWAGQLRQNIILKGGLSLEDDYTWFLPHYLIEERSHYTFNQLKQDNYLKGLNADAFSKSAGCYLREINHIHPFLEGNGRTQREFINQLAHHNGYHIEWQNVTRKQMIEASIEAEHRRTSRNLITLIRDNLIDRQP